MTSRPLSAALALLSMLVVGPRPAFADGKRDLEDGIAFYENLDTERAIERLESATKAKDLSGKDRARAHLYLGIVLFEVGRERDADSAWQQGFALDRSISAPPGTSPKVIQALEKARAASKGGVTPKPPEEVTPDVPTPGEPKTLEPKPPEPALTDPPPPPPEEDDGGPSWLVWAGVGLGVAAAAGLTVFLVTRGGSECEGAGGCALVTLE